ncbi:hypothetical protein BY458DRAFT_255401 [Sporodiniella umbellata]|nr:hypothetical protein BY458DRAFT_255401 [Sporodiniella umbellata]
MSSLVSCMGSDGNSVAFISRNNQSDSYYLHYWSTNGTLIYSNTLSSIKGCPDFANFTGSCSPSSVISQLQIGDSPSFINVRAFKDTKIVSAVNLATHSKNVIAFISEKLHGFAELSLNLLYSNGTISKWASLKQTGILLPSIETNGLYVLQNKTISEYQTNSSTNQKASTFMIKAIDNLLFIRELFPHRNLPRLISQLKPALPIQNM